MNRKGFTLIELLMVIVLIGIIALILVPNVMTLVNKNNEKSCKSFKDNVISATKMYVNENKYKLKDKNNNDLQCPNPEYKNEIEIELEDLVKTGNLSEPVKNPVTKSNVDLTKKVEVTFNCSTKEFTYVFDFTC